MARPRTRGSAVERLAARGRGVTRARAGPRVAADFGRRAALASDRRADFLTDFLTDLFGDLVATGFGASGFGATARGAAGFFGAAFFGADFFAADFFAAFFGAAFFATFLADFLLAAFFFGPARLAPFFFFSVSVLAFFFLLLVVLDFLPFFGRAAMTHLLTGLCSHDEPRLRPPIILARNCDSLRGIRADAHVFQFTRH